MTHPAPRRLLLVASDATSRGTAAPIRRYRLGQVLMDVEQMLAGQSLRSTAPRDLKTMWVSRLPNTSATGPSPLVD